MHIIILFCINQGIGMAKERKEKLLRILQIMETTDEKSPINAGGIIDILDRKYDLGKFDRRSVYQDILMLQSCGYAIVQMKDRKKGWYMEKHAFEDWEIQIMIDAIQQAKCISSKEAYLIQEKMLRLTSERGRKRFGSMLRPKCRHGGHLSDSGHMIEILLEAMYTHSKIHFCYTELTNDMQQVLRREGKIYELSLYAIYWSNNVYYLIGAHDNHDELTHYRLDRIADLQLTNIPAIPMEEKIKSSSEYSIQEYIDKSVNHFSGNKVRLTLVYKADRVTNAILYDFAGDDLRVRHVHDNVYEATFEKMNSVMLQNWLVSNAALFRVIKPDELCQNVKEQIKNALDNYETNL